MTICIKKFSSWYCFVYSTKEYYKVGSGYSHQLPINTKRFGEIIHKLYEMYRDELIPVVDKILNVQEYDDFYFYMTAILSKCVELSTTPTYLHFMLMCTFIFLIVWQRFHRQIKCFTFVKIASQCLVAVHDRCYKDLFKDQDDTKTFGSYCRRLNTILANRLTAKGRKKLSPFNHPQLTKLMASFKIITGDFKLTEHELKMLNETLSFLPGKDSFIDYQSTSRSVYDNKFLKEEISSNESEYDGTYMKKEIDMKEKASDEVHVKVEVDMKESESDEVVHVKVEVDTNASEFDEILVKQEVGVNELCEMEFDQVYVKQEVNSDETDSDEVHVKQEVNTDESEYEETSSKEENNSNGFQTYETSSEEENGTFKTDEDYDYTNRICKYCRWKCFEFVSTYEKGLLVKSENSL